MRKSDFEMAREMCVAKEELMEAWAAHPFCMTRVARAQAVLLSLVGFDVDRLEGRLVVIQGGKGKNATA